MDASSSTFTDDALLEELTEGEVELLLEEDIRELSRPSLREIGAVAQGVTYVATGLWPIIHLRSFEAVTGPKREGWLVKTVGLLVTAIGGTLLVGARDPVAAQRPLRVLATTSAAALAAIDVVYVAKRRIKPVYLLDAVLELAFVAAWLVPRKQRLAM